MKAAVVRGGLRHAHALVPAAVPLVVDLDGTLLKTDLLAESLTAFIARRPLEFARPLLWLLGGKAHLKDRLSEAVDIDPATLPYNEEVVRWLEAERAAGRYLVLATGAHIRQARKVAEYLGIFDEVLATAAETNLTGEAKRDALVSRYGAGGFDYVGNDAADLKVVPAADSAWLVAPSSRVEARARRISRIGGVLRPAKSGAIQSWVRALRFHQWLKNLLVLVPLAAAHRMTSLPRLEAGVLAFVLFGLCASSVYLLNDLLDVNDDRRHPRKRTRPFASGDLPLTAGWIVFPLLLVAAFAGAALLLPWGFVATLLAYYALTSIYSLKLKQVMMLDVVTLALLYTTRLIAGGAAVDVPLSFWLLTFSMFVFVSLALIKRYTELIAARGQGGEDPVRGRGYLPGDLAMVSSLGASAGYLAVMVLALYIQDPGTRLLYRHPEWIWLACPLLLYWISRTWMIAHRGKMHDDPVVFAVKDPVSLAVGALLIGVGLLAS